MKIAVGTKNPNKVKTVIKVVQTTLKLSADKIEIESVDVSSGVPEAPHDRETFDGAVNRARGVMEVLTADLYIGIESGLVERYGTYFEEAWTVVIAQNGDQRIGYSSGLMLPPIVVERMRAGEKHNDIMKYYDELFELPPDNRDTWSRYTGGNISRVISLEEALRNALIQTVPANNNLYLK